MTVFERWSDLRPEVQKHFDTLEQFVNHVEGKTIATESGDGFFVDEGTIDAEDAVTAINALVADVRRLSKALNQRDAEHLEPPAA